MKPECPIEAAALAAPPSHAERITLPLDATTGGIARALDGSDGGE